MGSENKETLAEDENLNLRRSLWNLFTNFLDNTTIHALPLIFSKTSLFLEKVFWVVAFLICFGCFSYQGVKITKEFNSYPYMTKNDIITQTLTDFPAVTICNVNMMRRSKIDGTRFEGLLAVVDDIESVWKFSDTSTDLSPDSSADSTHASPPDSSLNSSSDSAHVSSHDSSHDSSQSSSFYHFLTNMMGEFDFLESSWFDSSFDFNDYFFEYSWGESTDYDDWEAIYNQSRSPDFSDLRALLNPTGAELQEYGHQAEDFILQCSFDRRPCNWRNFSVFQHSNYGNCFTFNARRVDEPTNQTIETGQTGSLHGLQLTLFVDQPEHVGLLAAESGVKVSVHSPTEQPFPEDEGITASTGQKTTIGLRKVNITRLGGRYGEQCSWNGEGTDFKSETFSYTVHACLKQCLQDELLEKCDCITDIRFSNYTQCTSLNVTQDKCRQLVEYLYHRNALECACPISCREESYQRTISTSFWPSAGYEPFLAKQLAQINNHDNGMKKVIADGDKLRENVLKLVIYYEQLNYELNQQIPIYTVESLFGSLGGLLGLYLGMSFLSFGELCTLITGVIRICRKKAVSLLRSHDNARSSSKTTPQRIV